MNSTATEVEAVQRVLDSFQRELRGLRGGWISRTFMGEPPSQGFARQLSDVDGRGHSTGSVRGIWRITYTEIVALSGFVHDSANRTHQRHVLRKRQL